MNSLNYFWQGDARGRVGATSALRWLSQRELQLQNKSRNIQELFENK